MILSQIRRSPRLAPIQLPGLALVHLLPLFGILALLCAGLWGIGQHAAQKSELRLAETERYLAQFHAPPVADAWRRLSATWQAELHRQNALLERIDGRSGAARDEALRAYQQFVLETIEEHRLQPEIATVLAFVKRLALCVRVGSCDRQVVAARLGDALHRFRNQHYYYFALELPDEELDHHLDEIDGLAGDPGERDGL